MTRTALYLNLLVFFAWFFLNTQLAQPIGYAENTLPNFADFSKLVQNGEANVLRGVYISEVLAFPIIQQPAGDASYVSSKEGELTQFGLASLFSNVGLLAHNNLSGKSFSKLKIGQDIRLVYGDGTVEHFLITQVLSFQALQPTDPYSSFRNLNNNENLTVEQLFNKVYGGDRHLTFQTCIAANGISTWGRLFVIAVPRAEYSGLSSFDSQ